MIWGCISIYGPGPFLFIEGNLNGQLYKEMTEKTIIPYLFDLMARSETPHVFVDDNASAHSSRVASEVFHRFGVDRKYWPPKCPDLNPIENIWA